MAKPKQRKILKYGLYFERPKREPGAPKDNFTEDDFSLSIEFAMIAKGGRFKHGDRMCGHGLPYHIKEAKKLLWPDQYWHRWTHLITDTWLEKPGRTGCFGPSSSQKSFTFTRDGLVLFYARPNETTGLISSTTRDALARRIWDYVVSSDKAARKRFSWLPGSLIESKMMLLADASDEDGRSFKNGIVGVATKRGGQWQGLEEYVGVKNEVVFVIGDELHFMPMGILDSLANLESNEVCYFAGLGNLPDVDNPLGALCEPKIGWDAIPDTNESRVYETRWKNGRAIQLIGMDSPNLDYPEGQETYKGLIGRDYIEKCAENYGRESDKFNMFAAGKVPRSSMNRTVFTRAMCYKFNATHDVKWGHDKVVRGYGLDAAYSGVGGDRTVGFPFIIGKDVTGRWKFWLGTMHIYPGSTMKDVSHSEAIALECKRECEERGIEAAHVFFDGTGRSELTSAFARLWSPSVVPIEFGGPATERPSFTGEKFMDGDDAGNVKTCRDQFDRHVTELWFAVRTAILFDQMRGLHEDAILEGSQRKWEIVRGAKYCIETKDDMKERGLRSPDLCFIAGTWITTPFGEERIESLNVGDSVLTPMGVATIQAVRERKADNVIITAFSGGALMAGTADHKMFTWNKGWSRMDALTLTDEMESADNLHLWNIRNALFTKVAHTTFKTLVDTTKTETGRVAWTGFYTDASGLRRAVQFLRATAFITRMAIGQTIGSAIWRLCESLTMLRSIAKSALVTLSTKKNSTSIWTQLGHQLPNGTAQKKGGRGMLSTERSLGPEESHSNSSAIGAGSNMKRFAADTAERSSALGRALANPATGSISWMEGVWSVIRALRRTNTDRRSTVPIVVAQSPLQGLNTVYTLSLDRHNVYYANGILVANCDAIVCALEGARRLGFPLGKTPEVVQRRTNLWLDHMREEEWSNQKAEELV